jgi:hypothetical protein
MIQKIKRVWAKDPTFRIDLSGYARTKIRHYEGYVHIDDQVQSPQGSISGSAESDSEPKLLVIHNDSNEDDSPRICLCDRDGSIGGNSNRDGGGSSVGSNGNSNGSGNDGKDGNDGNNGNNGSGLGKWLNKWGAD